MVFKLRCHREADTGWQGRGSPLCAELSSVGQTKDERVRRLILLSQASQQYVRMSVAGKKKVFEEK